MATAHRRALERARRREEILDAARAVFAQAGYRQATVEQVAERAEVGKGTIYLYFQSKESMLADLLLEALAELTWKLQTACEACTDLGAEQRVRALGDAYLEFAQSSPDFFRLLNHYDRGDFQDGVTGHQRQRLLEESNRTLELVSQPIADGIAAGVFLPGDPREFAGVLWAALNGALALMAHPIRRQLVEPGDPSSFYRATLDLCLRGMANSSADVGQEERD